MLIVSFVSACIYLLLMKYMYLYGKRMHWLSGCGSFVLRFVYSGANEKDALAVLR